VYSEIVPSSDAAADMLAKSPLHHSVGGPSSVYAENAPQLDPALFDAEVPIFGSATASR